MNTPNPIEEATRKWLSKENSAFKYVGDTDDLTSVVLDGCFNLEELATRIASLAQTAERERIASLCYSLPNDSEEMYHLIFNKNGESVTSNMAELKRPRKELKCAKHGVPVEIIVSANEWGNAHGERWICPICVGEPEGITIKSNL